MLGGTPSWLVEQVEQGKREYAQSGELVELNWGVRESLCPTFGDVRGANTDHLGPVDTLLGL